MAPRKPLTVRSPGDFVLGIVYAGLAVVALFLLKDLNAGTASSMGPAYFPRMLAILLVVLSAAMIVKSLLVSDRHELRVRLLPLAFVIGGTVFFGIAVEALGMLVTVACIVAIYAFAYPGRSARETTLLALGTAAVSSIVFVKLLGLALTVLPRLS